MPQRTKPRLDADALKRLVVEALEDMKAEELVVLDVRAATSITDYMVVASGRSDRHVQGIADRVVEKVRECRGPSVAEERSRDWVLLDAGDVVAHVMLPDTRRMYSLEKLWSVAPPDAHASAAS